MNENRNVNNTGYRTRRAVAGLIGVDPSNYAPARRRKAAKTPTRKKTPQKAKSLDGIGYGIPKRTQNQIEKPPSLDVLMSMSLDELENSIPTDNFDFKPLISTIRQTFDNVMLKDDNFDFVEHEEIISKNRVMPENTDYCELPLTADITSRKLYKYIIEEDIEKFIEYVTMYIKDHQVQNCRGRCFRAIFESDSMRQSVSLNPFHIAAAMNKPKFIEAVLYNYLPLFDQSKFKCNNAKCAHFFNIIRSWLVEPSTFEGSTPVEIAAELGHRECVRLLLPEEVIEYLSQKKRNFQRRTYNAYTHAGDDTFLCKLAYNNQLDMLTNRDFSKLVENYNDSHLRLAICDAMCSGSLESAKRIYYTSKKEYLLSNEISSLMFPGRQFDNGIIRWKAIRMSPVQFALDSGYPEVLTEIPECLKFQKDCFGYTPLVQCVDLDDSSLNYAISLYRRNADREDLLVFIYQLLTKNRFDFFFRELEYFLTNFDAYEHRPGFDMKYNVPMHSVLPLSSALILNVDMRIIEKIREVYSKFRKHHNQEMMDEDVLRCYQYIQHYHFKFSDQIRLAVYLLLAPLTVGLSCKNKTWEEIMALNRKNFGYDMVYFYWLEKLKMVKSPPIYTWKKALEEAGNIVDTWEDGTKELVQNVGSLKLAKSSMRDLKGSFGVHNNAQNSGEPKQGILKKF